MHLYNRTIECAKDIFGRCLLRLIVIRRSKQRLFALLFPNKGENLGIE
jgi:hypothetical protein